MEFSKKQREFIKNMDNSRWTIKSGAVRSGKTHLDIVFTIPMRIRERSGKKGLNVIFGNTQGSLKRNILEPLQQHWGNQYISNINSENKRAYCHQLL